VQRPAPLVIDEGLPPDADPEPGTSPPVPAAEEVPPAPRLTVSDAEWEGEAKRGRARMLLIAGGVVGAVVAVLLLILALATGERGREVQRPRALPQNEAAEQPRPPGQRDGQAAGEPPATARKAKPRVTEEVEDPNPRPRKPPIRVDDDEDSKQPAPVLPPAPSPRPPTAGTPPTPPPADRP